MKKRIRILICLFPILNSFWFCNAQSKMNNGKKGIVGKYQVGREVMYLTIDNLFYLKRTERLNDVLTSECTDTIAQGKWKLLKKDLLLFANTAAFNHVTFDIEQAKKFSEDSIYIKIILPNDESFFTGRFEFDFFFSDGVGNFRSVNDYIVLSKDKVSRGTACSFSLSIKDAFPRCNPGTKCYQRIYFNVFENLRKEVSPLNYFLITLPNFTECFIEQMDMDNELMYYNGNNSVFWRGKEYKKL